MSDAVETNDLDRGELVFTLRRQVFNLWSQKYRIFNADGELIGFCKQKAFKLKEDIRVFTDQTMTGELVWIQARSVIDFSAAYDVTDTSSGTKLGALQRKGMKSILRDEWMVLNENDDQCAVMREDGNWAVARRFVPFANLVPQRFTMTANDGSLLATLQTHFNPFVHKLTVTIPAGCPLHPMLIVSAGVLLLAIERRQSS